MKIVAMSDLHGHGPNIEVPDGDILIIAGDLTNSGSVKQLEELNAWLGTLPHRHKIIISGNHDFLFETRPTRAQELITNAIYLQDTEVTIEGIRIYGSPWQPWFFDWAFNLQRGEEIRAKWDLIPDGLDILVTHGPPHGILDVVMDRYTFSPKNVGCEELLKRVHEVKPSYHIFGHIHPGFGEFDGEHTKFRNVAICDDHNYPVNQPIVFSIIK